MFALIFSFFVLSPLSHASVDSSSHLNETVVFTLRKPHTLAVAELKRGGDQALVVAKQMAFNDKWPLQTRWKAFMAYTQAKGKNSFPEIKSAMLSKTWFMRSAALTALQEIDPMSAKKWAIKLLNDDPALLVRMKALDLLKNDQSESVTEFFWKKIEHKKKLTRKRSLWMRGDITRLLLKSPRQKDLYRWVRLLHGDEDELKALASLALTKMHKTSIDMKEDSVAYWQKKFPLKNRL